MAENIRVELKDSLRIEQAAEQWINIVFEQIKHKKHSQQSSCYLSIDKIDKNEKLYSNT